MGKFNRDEKYIVFGEFYLFLLLGVYSLMVGALVPQIRKEYGISYELSGYLISANSIGMIVMNLMASYMVILLGLKRAYTMFHALVIIGLVTVTISGNPILLIIGMAFIGFARGTLANLSNQITNDVTKSDSRIINLVGVFFAFGACVAPFVVLYFSESAGNWRYANYCVAIAAAAGITTAAFMKFGKEGVVANKVKRGGLSFFKKKKFWLSFTSMFCYSGMEISIIGWLVTYFIEAQHTTTQFASAMATLLWASMLVGRLACSFIANRTTPAKMVLCLSIGVVVFMALFISNVSLPLLIVAIVGLGLFLSGVYSTIIAGVGPISGEYKLAFGYFFMLAGLGPVIFPTIIGVVAERYGIQLGIRALIAPAAALVVLSILNVRFDSRSSSA